MTTHKPSQLLYHNRTYLLATIGLLLILISLIFSGEHHLGELAIKLTGEVGGLLLVVGILHWMFEHGMRQEMLKEISEAVLGNERLRQSGFIDYQQDSSRIDKFPEEKNHWLNAEELILCIHPHEGFFCEEIIKQRCKHKKKTTLFLLAPDSPGAHYQQTTTHDLPTTAEKLQQIEKVLKDINDHENFIRVIKHQNILRYSLIFTKEYAWVKFFPNSHHRLDLPALKVRADSPSYQFFQKDLEEFMADISQQGERESHKKNPAVFIPAKFSPPLSKKVVISSKRGVEPDEHVFHLIEKNLTQIGCSVVIERHVKMDDLWKQEMTQAIQGADAVLVLLSAASIYSEMLAEEVEMAYQTAQEQQGKPRLLAIRVNWADPLPQNLANLLGHQPDFLWKNPAEDEKLLKHLSEKLAVPLGPSRPYELEVIGGAIPLDSKFYIERPVDSQLSMAIAQRERIILLKGARQVGKTSLLARGLQQARETHIKVLLTDFQRLGDAQLESIETFFITLGEMLAQQLGVNVSPRDKWRKQRNAQMNFENFFFNQLLVQIDQPILWAIDEADRLFPCPFRDEVFSLFRAWFNERAIDPSSPRSCLMLVIVYATETSFFIQNPSYSPFNVGTKLPLEDFTFVHMQDLHQRYGNPLSNSELEQFFALVGGHPYLARRGFNEIVARHLSFTDLMNNAENDEGPFGDHLRRIIMLLHQKTELAIVTRGILDGQPCPNEDSFYRLRSLGILKGEKEQAQLRCELYVRYLKKHLK